ncbi:PIG-L family deacetylase [Brevibacillus borstelensis]|jgi:LmbE family N-acetylglucosaminyl deacetylase|uniref:PIG-L deacetylase family protein n=1 Tax=Brevibacillus borstelensis TaxID=45462 RepID=UPI00203E66A2|nr:PIG-L deacetylase family protein [Brevibacillus borstelensis]MCM3620821.1 PIG-L family deacetylase [Brevibacillus borstelensis]
MKEKRILFVFAHPDDETFTSGVTICKYAAQPDVSIHLLCATRGEAGKPGDPPICTMEELPAEREAELRKAASILGISRVEFMGYRDKELSNIPPAELAQKINESIERIKPQVVITFAPHGISGHPDHQAISAATTSAVQALPAGSVTQKLYYVTHAADQNFGIASPPYTDPIDSITTIISAPAYVPQVAQALAAHRTQHLSVSRVFPGVLQGDTTYVRTVNHFILVGDRPRENSVEEKETDLFSGITT